MTSRSAYTAQPTQAVDELQAEGRGQRPVGAPANEFMMELLYRQSQACRLLQSVKPIRLTCRCASGYMWLLYREVVRRKGENK